jgi:hypothetical protein
MPIAKHESEQRQHVDREAEQPQHGERADDRDLAPATERESARRARSAGTVRRRSRRARSPPSRVSITDLIESRTNTVGS